MPPTTSIRAKAKELGLPYETYYSRLRRNPNAAPDELAYAVKPNQGSFPINGLDLTAGEWCHYLGVTHQAMNRAAKRHHLTSLEELKRRFKERPDLFPKHLLDPNHPRYHEVKHIHKKPNP